MATARQLAAVIWLGCALALAARAEPPQQLSWDDLVPKLAVPANPFARLTRAQAIALGDVAAARDRRARGERIEPGELADERSALKRLAQEGVDVEALLAQRQRMMDQSRARASALNTTLDGRTVHMPGYLLPLEYSGKLVTEFLLVPWAGACIHTPPPPLNQIVLVTLERPAEFNGLYQPVWVTGRMRANARRASVYLVDGNAELDIGYSLQASEVLPYTE